MAEASTSAEDATENFVVTLCAAREGDQSRLGALLEIYRGYLTSAAMRDLSRDIAAKLGASDIVQETLLEASQVFAKFEGSSEVELRAWLTKILSRNVIDSHRHFRNYAKRDISRESPGKANSQIASPSNRGGITSSSQEQFSALETALDRLGEAERTVIELRTFQNRSFEEVGLEIGRSAEASRKLWSRAIWKLTQELRPHERGSA